MDVAEYTRPPQKQGAGAQGMTVGQLLGTGKCLKWFLQPTPSSSLPRQILQRHFLSKHVAITSAQYLSALLCIVPAGFGEA